MNVEQFGIRCTAAVLAMAMIAGPGTLHAQEASVATDAEPTAEPSAPRHTGPGPHPIPPGTDVTPDLPPTTPLNFQFEATATAVVMGILLVPTIITGSLALVFRGEIDAIRNRGGSQAEEDDVARTVDALATTTDALIVTTTIAFGCLIYFLVASPSFPSLPDREVVPPVTVAPVAGPSYGGVGVHGRF